MLSLLAPDSSPSTGDSELDQANPLIEGAGDGPHRIDPHGLHFDTSCVMRGAASFVDGRRLSHAMHDASAAVIAEWAGQPSRPAGGEMALQLPGSEGNSL